MKTEFPTKACQKDVKAKIATQPDLHTLVKANWHVLLSLLRNLQTVHSPIFKENSHSTKCTFLLLFISSFLFSNHSSLLKVSLCMSIMSMSSGLKTSVIQDKKHVKLLSLDVIRLSFNDQAAVQLSFIPFRDLYRSSAHIVSITEYKCQDRSYCSSFPFISSTDKVTYFPCS